MSARIVLSSALVLTLGTAACMTAPRPPSSYGTELDRLTADCAERGGSLTPIGGVTSGRPQTDFACRIPGGATRIGQQP